MIVETYQAHHFERPSQTVTRLALENTLACMTTERLKAFIESLLIAQRTDPEMVLDVAIAKLRQRVSEEAFIKFCEET
jgi:hypothetical protein